MWVTIKAERVLSVARGRDVILCDRQEGLELVVKLSPRAIEELRRQLAHFAS